MHCRLSTLMGEKRYRIQDVCERTGINRTTISNLYHDKNRRVDYAVFEKLCVLFHCELNDLLYYEEE
ncbi:MAG: helix-turn-helix transcriptional regulator [Oscillospiraceae bacterium]|nr:helix-turn-helix transcriptional regulator [Oscillospiraceae bacterium]